MQDKTITKVLYDLNPHLTMTDIVYILESGCLGVYSKSLDKPFLDNHLFVMFELKELNKQWRKIDDMFTTSPFYYTDFTVRNNFKTYNVYAFVNLIDNTNAFPELPLNDYKDWEMFIKRKSQGLSIDKS